MARRRKGDPVSGWVNLDKPLGMTSTQAVGKIRWLLNAQKAGHAGTLDPLATGVLPIALGDATKTVPFMVDAVKMYDFTLTWGENTDSWDAEGVVTKTSDVRPSPTDIEGALPQFMGDISQVPPRFSAIKIDGQRSYDLARSGEVVELKPRHVRVDDITLSEYTEGNATLSVTCGKGTYIRSIARDLAHTLGACGHVTMLRRMRVGPFRADDTFALDGSDDLRHKALALAALKPVETALDDIPVLAVTDIEAENLKHGRAIVPTSPIQTDPAADTPQWVLVMADGKAIALCDARGGIVSPKRVFNL